MKKHTRFIALLLTLALAFTGVLAIGVFADETPTRETASAEITLAPNGAKAIASMTFDDGKMPTAQLLNQLCREYGLEASLMLITDHIGTNFTAAQWLDVFSQGYLYPDSHSSGHKYLGGSESYSDYKPEYYTEEIYEYEVEGSLADLKAAFPDYDTLTFAIPSSSYVADAMEHVKDTFYAVRTGTCPLYSTSSSIKGKVNTLSPTIGTGYGSWHNLYTVRMQSVNYPNTNSPEQLVEYLGKCVDNNGWFISICHGVGTDTNLDMTEAQIREVFAAMKYYQDKGDLWVANFTDATKYVRERQGSILTAETDGTNYYLNITLKDYTEDGLELGLATATNSDGTTRKVFNMPLTVKLEVPGDWVRVSYSQAGGEAVNAVCFDEGGKNYVYVNTVPDGGEVTVTDATLDSERPDFIIGSELIPEGAWTPTSDYTGILFGVWASEADYLGGKAPAYWYQNTDSTKTERVANDPNNPVGMYATNLTNANICLTAYNTYCAEYTAAGFVPGFVRLYQDVSTGSAFITDAAVQYVIDLGGHKLTCSTQFTVGEQQGESHAKTSLTIKNGLWHYKSSSFYFRPDISVLFYNVAMTVDGANVNTDGGFELWVFDTCKIYLNNPATQFIFGYNRESPYQSYLVFKNTDLVQSDTPTVPLFRINATPYGKINYSVIFDKNSSVKRESDNWVSLSDSTVSNGATFAFVQGLYFERGCQISPAAIPDYNMAYTYNQLVSTTVDGKTVLSLEETTRYANTDGGWLEVAVVEPSLDGISYTLNTDSAIATLTGCAIYDPITATSETAFSSDTFEANENFIPEDEWTLTETVNGLSTIVLWEDIVWKPTGTYKNILFGVWKTENDYLMGYAPEAWYSKVSTDDNYADVMRPEHIATADGVTFGYTDFTPGYVHLFGDVTTYSTSQIIIGNTQQLTINLNKFTLTNGNGIRLGGTYGNYPNCKLTMKNGYWIASAGQNQLRPYTSIYLDDVDVTTTKSNYEAIFADGGAKYIQFKDCSVNFTNAAGGFLKYYQGTLEFINTSITQTGTPTTPLIWFSCGDGGYSATDFTVIFDEDTSVNRGSNVLVGISTKAAAALSAGELKVIIEEGASFSESAIPDFTYYTADDRTSEKTVFNCSDEGSVCSVSIVKPDEHSTVYSDFYYKQESNGFSFLSDLTGYTAAEFDETMTYIYQLWNTTLLDTGSSSTALSYRDNSIIKFFADFEIGHLNTLRFGDVTFDLNGYNWTRAQGYTSSIQIGVDSSGGYYERVVKFINSNPNKRSQMNLTTTGNPFQARPGSYVYFENIDIQVTQQVFNDGGFKLLSFDNCTITSTNKGYIANSSGLGANAGLIAVHTDTNHSSRFKENKYNPDVTLTEGRDLILNNTTLTNIRIYYSYMNQPDDKFSVYISGNSLINKADDNGMIHAYKGYNSNPEASAARNIYLYIEETVKINDTSIKWVVKDNVTEAAGNCSVTVKVYPDIDGTTPTTEGTPIADCVFWSYNDGYYSYGNKPKSSDLGFTANLTLFSDFNLNFFANPGTVSSITYNGEELEMIEWDGKLKFTLSDITPDTAAETRTFVVTVTKGDAYYELSFYYSVLNYAKTIVDGNYTDFDKQFVSAVMDYVKAAYNYMGKTAPTFEGVTHDKQDAGTPAEFKHEAISGVQFELGAGVKVRFNLNTEYTGTLTVGDATYEVENGTVGAATYVTVNLRAYELYSEGILVSDKDGEATYTLDNYVDFADNYDDDKLVTLIQALYDYSYYAAAYKAEQN